MLVQVRDPETYEIVTAWDDSDYACNPWAGGDYQGHCGGCVRCMEMQADYSGLLVVRPAD